VQNAYKDIRAAAAKEDRIEFLSLWQDRRPASAERYRRRRSSRVR
jgi:hypothetical protein